jgi:hypothetical protein
MIGRAIWGALAVCLATIAPPPAHAQVADTPQRATLDARASFRQICRSVLP